MKPSIPMLVLPLLLWPAFAGANAGQPAPTHPPASAGEGAHGAHAAHAAHASHLGPAEAGAMLAGQPQWVPDAPLMQGMRRMAAAVQRLGQLEQGAIDQADVARVAGDVQAAADFMFGNCELEAEPDVLLHGLLARLMAGAQTLAANPADSSPVADMRAAVDDYPRFFDDPGFRSADTD